MASGNNKKETFRDRLKKTFSRGDINKERNKSVSWLRAKLDNFSVYSRKMDPNKIQSEYGSSKVKTLGSNSLIGGMFLYQYDPKWKKTLPFYDRYPLSILVGPVQGQPNAFFGINLHYLPEILRASLFDALLDTLNTKTITDKSRFQITYQMLKSTQSMSGFAPCFKMYLGDHVRGSVVRIHPEDWIKVLFLRTQSFEGASTSEVYRWSRSKL